MKTITHIRQAYKTRRLVAAPDGLVGVWNRATQYWDWYRMSDNGDYVLTGSTRRQGHDTTPIRA